MGRYALHCEVEALRRTLPMRGIGIEMGAGTGIFAEHLREDERIIICLDPSPGMLGKAKKRGLPSILGVIEYPPLRDRCLDFAYMVATLEFLIDPVKALEAVKNPLKPAKPLLLLFINRESSWGHLYLKLSTEGDPIFSKAKLYTYSEALGIVEKAGFTIRRAISTLLEPPDKPGREAVFAEVERGGGVILLELEPLGEDTPREVVECV